MSRAIAALALAVALPALAGAQETADAIERRVSLSRAALTARQLVKANQLAEEAYALATAALEQSPVEDGRIRAALGAAIETRAAVMVEDGARAEAVRFLRLELDANRATSIEGQLGATLDRVNLEGRPAPAIDGRFHVGPRLPGAAALKGKVVLLFFWGHWCAQCKADGPMIAELVDKYRSQGLTLVAPTKRYGYVADGRPAPPDKELRHIVQVRDTDYGFLRSAPVPLSDSTYEAYGVTTIPMYVLVDRQGIVRLYRSGRMTAAELDAAIRGLL